MANMETYWAITGAIFILGLLLGYVGRTIVGDIHAVADLQSELDEVNAKVDSYNSPEPHSSPVPHSHGQTESAILKNVTRNSNL